MIQSQIDDFLKSTKNLEEIQVIRKLHSITLQIDLDVINNLKIENDCTKPLEDEKEEESESDYEEMTNYEEMTEIEEEELSPKEEDIVVIVSNYSQCMKCEKVLTSNEHSEIHEFFKHSLLGIQIDNEVEEERKDEVDGRKCGFCGGEFEELSHHLLLEHSKEFLAQVNQIYGVDESSVDLGIVEKFVNYVKGLICGEEVNVEEGVKEYFYEVYSGDTVIKAEEFEEEVVQLKESQQKSVKNAVNFSNLNEESREWVRNEINTRKKLLENEFGVKRVIYRCAYCNVYSSNSAPGFRYHLISKHLKDRNNIQELRPSIISTSTSFSNIPPVRKAGRNTCTDCNLKFKDQKMLNSHQNCHELFETISQYSCFPACHTCTSLYIDDASLNLHLSHHDNNKDITKPVQVPSGAIITHGKRATNFQVPETSNTNFAWRCGHCELRFNKETSCRFHLLMVHASIFTCPMDKREFSGIKAVSLYCHHLKNKHSELFPDMMFPCTFCNMQFTSIYSKLSHMKGCDEKKYGCDHCHKKVS